MSELVAVLYVMRGTPYAQLEGVDLWPESRDARRYAGPWPVVAHPPCERWGRYWSGGPSAKVRRELGDDGGCFAAALAAVRRWGGVIEHPEASHAWRRFGIPTPPREGGWIGTLCGGWTCCVEQGHYGHRARKATWLYLHGAEPPPLTWGASAGARIDEGFHSTAERRVARAAGARPAKRLSGPERERTPIPFAELLIGMARNARRSP